MLNSSYDDIRINFEFEREFALVLENNLGPSAVTHYNRRVSHIIIVYHNGVWMVEWSRAHRFETLVTVVVRGSSPKIDHTVFFPESN